MGMLCLKQSGSGVHLCDLENGIPFIGKCLQNHKVAVEERNFSKEGRYCYSQTK